MEDDWERMNCIWRIFNSVKDENNVPVLSMSTGVSVARNRILTSRHNLPTVPLDFTMIALSVTGEGVHHMQFEHERPEWDLSMLKFKERFVRVPYLPVSNNPIINMGDGNLSVVDHHRNVAPVVVFRPCVDIDPRTFKDINSYVFNPDKSVRPYDLLGDFYPPEAFEHPNLPVIVYNTDDLSPGRSGGPIVRNGDELVGIHLSTATLYNQPSCGLAVHLSAVREFLAEARIVRQRARARRARERAKRVRASERARERARLYPGFSGYMKAMRLFGPLPAKVYANKLDSFRFMKKAPHSAPNCFYKIKNSRIDQLIGQMQPNFWRFVSKQGLTIRISMMF